MYYSKYHAKKTTYDGITYDSKKEAKRAYELIILQRAGHIKDLQRQVQFELIPEYTNNKGEKIRSITYVCDFVYFDNESRQWIAEDVKGMRTDVYKIKKKLFEYKYVEYKFIES